MRSLKARAARKEFNSQRFWREGHHSNADHLRFVFLNGMGSSGKDTQAAFIKELLQPAPVEQLRRKRKQPLPEGVRREWSVNEIRQQPQTKEVNTVAVISTGDVIREAKKEGTIYHERYYKLLAPFINNTEKGGLVPDKIMMQVVDDLIRNKIAEGARNFIFTGFPRTKRQLKEVDKLLREYRKEKYEVSEAHVCLAVTPERSARLAGNRYNEARQRELEEGVAEGTYTRKDDHPNVVQARIANYREHTRDMLKDLLDGNRLLIVQANRDIPTVRAKVRRKLGYKENTLPREGILFEGRQKMEENGEPLEGDVNILRLQLVHEGGSRLRMNREMVRVSRGKER